MHWLASATALSPVARAFLLSHDSHQQIEAADGIVLASSTDVVRDLDTPSEEVAQLRIVMTDRLVVTGRRRALQAIENTRQAIAAGRRLPVPASLLAVIVEQILQIIGSSAEALQSELDGIEDRILDDAVSDERRGLGEVRRTAARLHRRLAVLAALFARLEEETDEEDAGIPELQALPRSPARSCAASKAFTAGFSRPRSAAGCCRTRSPPSSPPRPTGGCTRCRS